MAGPLEIKPTLSEKHAIPKPQIVFLVIVLAIAAVFFLDRQFGMLERIFRERVAIPFGQPYAEATVVGVYEGVVLAERVVLTDAAGNALQKKMEILTDEKTVFAEITSSGPIKISGTDFVEGDIIWIYNRIRTMGETLAEPVDTEPAISFEDMVKNPREKIRADFMVKVGGK